MYNIAKFMHSLFNISLSRTDFNNGQDDKDSDDDDIVGRNTFRVQFRILDNTLRQSFIDFGRFFALDRLLVVLYAMKNQKDMRIHCAQLCTNFQHADTMVWLLMLYAKSVLKI